MLYRLQSPHEEVAVVILIVVPGLSLSLRNIPHSEPTVRSSMSIKIESGAYFSVAFDCLGLEVND